MNNLSPPTGRITRLTGWLSFVAVAVGILFRFLYLDADPQYSEWVGYITDEGRWVRHGRNLALHGNLADGRDLHLFLAPLFQLSNYLFFELFGVKIWASRMLSAISGSAILIVFWVSLRRAITPQALLLGLALLALQADLVTFSRLAVPEMPVMFFQLAIYFLIVSGEGSVRRMAAAGILTAMALAIKLTMVLTVPIFFAVILAMPRSPAGGTGRWRDVASFGIAMALPLLMAGWVGYFYLRNTPAVENAVESFFTAVTFLRFSGLYYVVNFPFNHTVSLSFILWGLGLWLSVLGWRAGWPDEIDDPSHRYLATSGIWMALYFSLMVTLAYFPSRYQIHVLLPMALFIAVGLSHLQRLGIEKLIDFLAGAKGPAGLLWTAVAGFPAAAISAPIVLLAFGFAGFDPARLITKVASLTLVLIGCVYILYRLKYNRTVLRYFLICPLIGGAGWGLVLALGGSSLRPFDHFSSQIASLAFAIVVASTILFLLGSRWSWWLSNRGAQSIALCAIFYLTITLSGMVPGYLEPRYTLRDTSRELSGLYSGSRLIASVGADGLFNENNLPYESLTAPEFNELGKKPEIVAVVFFKKWMQTILDRDYHVTKTYDLYNHPAPAGWGAARVSFKPNAIPVTLYEKNDASSR